MNTNFGWRLLLLFVCLSFAALSAVAQPQMTLYDTGTPAFNADPTGTPLANPNDISAGSFQCLSPDCDIEGFQFWSFNNGGTPTGLATITWQFDPVVFNFKGVNTGTADVFQIGDCFGGPTGTTYCLNSFNIGKSIDVPMGTYWFWLDNATVGQGFDPNPLWADVHIPGEPSTTFELVNGVIQSYPDAKSFAVFGAPTNVPEPSSLLLLGSGVLGGLGLLRRRFLL